MASKDISSSPVLKKRKVYKCTYKVEWSVKYPVTKSNGNPSAFYCVPSKKNLSSLKGFETEADTNLAGQTIRTEVMHTYFMVQHTISFLTAEHLLPLYAQMFPDPKIAKNFKCS